MKLVMPSVTEVKLDRSFPVPIAIMKKIERCGRIAYRSEDRITEYSYIPFIKNIVKRNHTSVLEHGRVTITMDITDSEQEDFEQSKGSFTNYSFVQVSSVNRFKTTTPVPVFSGNLRALLEFVTCEALQHPFCMRLKKILQKEFQPIFGSLFEVGDSDELPYMIEEAHDGHTFHVVTDRGVLAEWTRHRIDMSFTVESTRYCNYEKTGMTFCLPVPFEFSPTPDDNESKWIFNALNSVGAIERKENNTISFCANGLPYDFFTYLPVKLLKMNVWKKHMKASEEAYTELIQRGCTPQEARTVLPNSLKSEFCVTATKAAWDHFFSLRCAKDAHPQIRYLANKVKELVYPEGELNDAEKS